MKPPNAILLSQTSLDVSRLRLAILTEEKGLSAGPAGVTIGSK